MNETDFPEAYRRCDGDLELIRATAMMVAEDAPIELQKIEVALAEGECVAAHASSHALKGMLATFEQSAAVAGLQQVEKAAAQKDLAGAKQAFAEVRSAIVTLISRITSASQ
jgi:HPt (histidine-containing phosphotransfer) domain-containing protein